MVCDRCISAVKTVLNDLDIPFNFVKLGEAQITREVPDYEVLSDTLKKVGFVLIKSKNIVITEKIKAEIVNYIHYNEDKALKIKFSDFLSKRLGYNYSHLSYVFSETEGETIEHYLISQKTEKVKELISYNELNFTDIAAKLNYSSVSHLSRQFKKHHGMTLSEYKKQHLKNRKALDKLS